MKPGGCRRSRVLVYVFGGLDTLHEPVEGLAPHPLRLETWVADAADAIDLATGLPPAGTRSQDSGSPQTDRGGAVTRREEPEGVTRAERWV